MARIVERMASEAWEKYRVRMNAELDLGHEAWGEETEGLREQWRGFAKDMLETVCRELERQYVQTGFASPDEEHHSALAHEMIQDLRR